MKWKWEARAKHWGDWHEIAKSLGFLDSKNNVCKWDGPAFWAQWAPRGHDSTDFNACKCGLGLPEQGMGVEAS